MPDTAARDEWVDDDSDVCRVCRTEAEEGNPLMHPCKCSGSVRYVHGECLQNWLAHNGKRYCEICGHHYTFSKVYPVALPSRIPAVVYARQSFMFALKLIWGVARACIAICSWLVLLPILTMCFVRVILCSTDYLLYACVLSGIKGVIEDSHAELNSTFVVPNQTLADGLLTNVTFTGRDRVLRIIAQNSTDNIMVGLSERMSGDMRNLVAFVFRGQIVALSVAAGLIGLVLLREWISQLEWNARPPMEEEGEPDPSQWTFRNGQAIRLSTNSWETDQESNQADAGYDTADDGDNFDDATETQEEGFIAVREVQDAQDGTEVAEKQIRPIPAFVPDRAFTAPELLEEEGESSSTVTGDIVPEVGPSSRPAADVPEDAGESPSPLFRGPAWEPSAQAGPSSTRAEASRRSAESQTGSEEATQNPGGSDNHGARHHDENDSESQSHVDRKVHIPDAPADAYDDGYRTPSPPTAVADSSYQRLLQDPNSSKDGGPSLQPISSHNEELDHDERQVQESSTSVTPDQKSPMRVASPDSGSPETPGSPESGVFSDADDEEAIYVRAVTAAVDEYREWQAQNPDDEEDMARRIANLDARFPEANRIFQRRQELDVRPRRVPPEEQAEPPAAEFNIVNDGAGFEVNAEFVERVMAVNNMDAAGMDVAPEDEDDRPLDADDWDGILGVIGFIGPLTDLLANHLFVTAAMGFLLSLLVGLPVIIGKILLATDHIRAARDLYFVNVRAISLLSKVVLAVTGRFLGEILVFPRMVVKTLAKYVLETAGVTGIDDAQYFGNAINLTSSYFTTSYSDTAIKSVQYATELPVVGPATNKVLDGLELLGQTAHELYKAYRLRAISIAASTDTRDQMLCLILGMTSVAFSIICVAVADAANLLNLPHGILQKTRNVQVFLKVVFFMSLEIVSFPVFVGFAMDLLTLPLFSATVADRLERLSNRPFGTMFVLWASGTVFMISFASFLTHMKKKGCRPGAVYFIRDPSDPSHSPVKEIMDRPALSQVSRLAVSAAMYSIVLFFVCGAVPYTLWLLGNHTNLFKGFLPLRLDHQPLSSVPFDLIFLHLVLPPSWEGLDLFRRSKKIFLYWWTWVVSALDLSSLIFGIQGRARPQTPAAQTAWIVADAACQFIFGRYDNRATRARVPNNDRVELVSSTERRKEHAFIPLDERGAPKTEEDKLRLLRQDRLARHAGRNPFVDFTTITLPEHWRTRVYALLAMILLSAATSVAGLFFVPLAIGRQAAGFLFDGPIYDGYSWLFGIYICLGSFIVGRSVRRHVLEMNRAERLRRSSKSARVKRSVFAVGRGAYAIIMLYLILPLLIGIGFELSVAIPARYGLSRDLTPVLHLWDAWATGAAILSLYVSAIGVAAEGQAQGPRGSQLRDAFKQPFKQTFWTLTSVLFFPIALLVMVILLPWILLSGIRTGMELIGVPLPTPSEDLTLRVSYPMSWIFGLVLMSWRMIKRTIARVRQWMIDAEYVISERVENYEPEKPTALVVGTTFRVTDGEVEAIIEGSDDGGEWEDVAVGEDVVVHEL